MHGALFRRARRLPLDGKEFRKVRDVTGRIVRPVRAVLITRRRAEGIQASPVSALAIGEESFLVTSSEVTAKTRNIQRDPRVALCVVSDNWYGPWRTVEGKAEIRTLPGAFEDLKEFHRVRDGGPLGAGAEYDARLLASWQAEAKVLIAVHAERVARAPSLDELAATIASRQLPGDR
ncbi:pyridoxamine 5'-phosphate oxidase family protein [Streptomyces pseudovenezuelae]|uniref:Pyridoxamine 5'-phosphate oxidase family protein n=1 Tax=Streptomyces pseudovenezuelae TaxID=67350 RepID=A0ABZ1X2L7_9ACTN|nr:pyridoxamine 5'-phosphate oxidase family protein [Streptomyces pseudovenezuelae]WUA88739.1 pyridoxamine 5'-phosphate oxidase family protein [Streptomyces pseudovenezuelae]